MNFFNTRYYCNAYSHCQRVRGRKAKFFTIYPQNGTVLRLGSDPKEPNMAVPAAASGPEYDRSHDRERSRRADQRSFGRLAPNHRLKPSPHVDYEGFHAHFGDRSLEKSRALSAMPSNASWEIPATSDWRDQHEIAGDNHHGARNGMRLDGMNGRASSRSWTASFRGSIRPAKSVSLGQICARARVIRT